MLPDLEHLSQVDCFMNVSIYGIFFKRLLLHSWPSITNAKSTSITSCFPFLGSYRAKSDNQVTNQTNKSKLLLPSKKARKKQSKYKKLAILKTCEREDG